MNLTDIIPKSLAKALSGKPVIGIDIGSRAGKGVLITDDRIFTTVVPTGLYMQETADDIFASLLALAEIPREEIAYIVGTGYGRIAMGFEGIPSQVVTEISCHAMGAHHLNPETRTIIDIGGQDSKVIRVDPATGKVAEFIMNDKCAAGTGRFLEKVAQLLDLELEELGEAAVSSEKPCDISSQCVVFAESEVISLRASGEKREDIAAGIHFASARRVRNLLNRIGLEPAIVFTGGVSNNAGMRHALETLLELPIPQLKLDTVFAGALGAAAYARSYARAGHVVSAGAEKAAAFDLTDLHNRIAKQQESLIQKSTGKKNVAYLCSYTPPELLNAAGVSHFRLMKAGSIDEVASGELVTQSVFCDFSKSTIGAFREGNPLYGSVDRLYTFFTCDCIKKVAEAANEYHVPTGIYVLPRIKGSDNSRDYFRKEILHLKADLEQFAETTIEPEAVREQIVLYNKIRAALRRISELRKRPSPPLTGRDFAELVKGYYYLPPEEQLEVYQEIYQRLSAVPDDGERPIRLLLAGGIVADGDRRLLDLLEDEVGARIVVDDNCTGLTPMYNDIDEQGEPFAALAAGYLDRAPCARMKPLDDRIAFSGKLAQEYQVDGVIYYYLKFCPCYGQTKNEFLRHYQGLGLPVLEVPSDYSHSDLGQLKTRIEAFVEVFNEKRRGSGKPAAA
jgi:predicted CoA-substrate-specific enzyme activase